MDTLLPNCHVFMFDGKSNFETWYQEMKNSFKAIGLCSTIDEEFEKPPEGTTLTDDIATKLEKKRHLDYKARYYLAIKVELHVSKKYLDAKSSKEAWTILVKSYRRAAAIKKEKLQEFRSQFEVARMKPTESVKEFIARITEIVNDLRTNGEVLEEVKIIEKILQSLSLNFNTKKVTLEAIKDLSTLRFDDLEGELVTYERSLNQHKDETLDDAPLEKDDQSKEKEGTPIMTEINQEGQNSKIDEKRREGTCKFCCDRDFIESEEKSNNVQIDLPRISAIVKNEDLVARYARPKEIGVLQEKLFDGIEDEPSNEKSKTIHQEKVFDNLPKIKAEIT
ncbi:uncharacterized protein [Nicotiana tomentosiformis]|uniref:uncharacterized protein n=1 Tax=Nicotiana tomentosiformis TaxID=4098 RepID=UPI00388C8D6D